MIMFSAKGNKIKTSSPSPSSAETIANNDDLLTEILLRLPIKSLLKFKCVSKHWLSLISDPLFYLCLNPSNSPCALMVHKWPRLDNPEFDFIKLGSNHSVPPFKTLNFINDASVIKIIQSCNGLLLCNSFSKNSRKLNYYVYNPTTKQRKILPALSQAGKTYGLYLAFDPRKSPYYKVICVRQCDMSQSAYRIQIYSPETGCWRVSSTATFILPLGIGFHGGVFWNDSIHWYTDAGPSIRFDINQEKVKKMPMPSMPDGCYRRRVAYFGESRGHLCLVEIHSRSSTQFNVCEMERDHSGWSVKYRVNLDGVVSAFPGMIKSYLNPSMLNYYVYQIMGIEREETNEGDYLVLHIPAQIVRYNLKDGSFRKLCDFAPNYKREDASNFGYCNAYEYIQSLACV
ncbi:hypothetical protein GH714_040378 [Hevea brasiliensis]|uniref:F-box domain-containing protein n=1 Tax=Hevea brasiliensis TaxID=3981 RepID=A0A6A6MRJ6_HEVBR|nr:hypothetical protein GH714_040378 [Hevea brasiliensis]